jgi:hypothetical protein
MKKVKKVLVVLATGAFVAMCVFNVILGSANYDKVSSSLLTLEALASGEGGATGDYSSGKWVYGTNTHIKYFKNNSTGICYDQRKYTRTFECNTIVLNPVYGICGTVETVIQEVPIACSVAGL